MTSVTDFVWRKDSGIKTSAAQTPRETTLASAPSFAQVGDGILCHGHSERFMGSIHVAWLPLTNGLKFVDW